MSSIVGSNEVEKQKRLIDVSGPSLSLVGQTLSTTATTPQAHVPVDFEKRIYGGTTDRTTRFTLKERFCWMSNSKYRNEGNTILCTLPMYLLQDTESYPEVSR
mmetsp:Transcript_7484/g.17140  ORF Transcript_7484/g.17140 Transcript_7484/m.17140 type:complete len:103 (-) Transcript_7484:2037-2345(-)